MADDNTYTIESRFFCCFRCRNIVASHDDIVDKSFVAGGGRAYLFTHVMNVSEGPKVDRQLISGIYRIADVFCGGCEEGLGLKYYRTYEEQHKYKEGKTVLAKSKIAQAYDSTFY